MLTTKLLTKYLARRAEVKELQARSEINVIAKAKAKSSQPVAFDDKLEQDGAEHFEPLSFEQAQQLVQDLRKTVTLLTPWRLLKWQFAVGVLGSVVAYIVFGDRLIVLSVACGALAVVLPAGLFAWGLQRGEGAKSALLASAKFFVWEAVKVGLTVVILFAAPFLIANLNWLALLAGFVVTMKVYWIAFFFYPMRKNFIN